MSGKLGGRVAVVTGASKGLGKAMAMALAVEGARVALIARDRQHLTGLAEAIRAARGTAEAFPADVISEEQVRRACHDVVTRFGEVNILINNAGIDRARFFLDTYNVGIAF